MLRQWFEEHYEVWMKAQVHRYKIIITLSIRWNVFVHEDVKYDTRTTGSVKFQKASKKIVVHRGCTFTKYICTNLNKEMIYCDVL